MRKVLLVVMATLVIARSTEVSPIVSNNDFTCFIEEPISSIDALHDHNKRQRG